MMQYIFIHISFVYYIQIQQAILTDALDIFWIHNILKLFTD